MAAAPLPPRWRLWRAEQTGDQDGPVDFQVVEGPEAAPRYAFFGVRSCDLHAIAIHDEVFLRGTHPDPIYRDRREDVFIVAVHCGEPASTCFCTSMGTGPRAPGGYDLALTELLDGPRHELLVEAGSERGADVLRRLPQRAAVAADREASRGITERAARRMTRAAADRGHP